VKHRTSRPQPTPVVLSTDRLAQVAGGFKEDDLEAGSEKIKR
jgi:hypothetical protein